MSSQAIRGKTVRPPSLGVSLTVGSIPTFQAVVKNKLMGLTCELTVRHDVAGKSDDLHVVGELHSS
jgi:hypothetical protein